MSRESSELNYNTITDLFTGIADAIRSKTGESVPIVADDFPDAILDISGGTGAVTQNQDGYIVLDNEEGSQITIGPLSVTQNGTYTAPTNTAYSPVTVNVSGGQWTTDGIINRTEPNGALESNTTTIRDYAFSGYTLITSVSLPQCTVIGNYGFSNCTGIVSVSAPNVTSFYQRNYAFKGCTSCTIFYLPNCTIVGTEQFNGCSSLPYLVLPKATTIYNNALNGCTNLEAVDLGTSAVVFERTGIFKNDAKLKTLVLRRTTIVPYKVLDAFDGTPFASGGSGGTIYIPKVLYDHLDDGTSSDYKAATNWSTLNGYGTITWAKIEGSYYETHYVDGTEIPT